MSTFLSQGRVRWRRKSLTFREISSVFRREEGEPSSGISRNFMVSKSTYIFCFILRSTITFSQQVKSTQKLIQRNLERNLQSCFQNSGKIMKILTLGMTLIIWIWRMRRMKTILVIEYNYQHNKLQASLRHVLSAFLELSFSVVILVQFYTSVTSSLLSSEHLTPKPHLSRQTMHAIMQYRWNILNMSDTR